MQITQKNELIEKINSSNLRQNDKSILIDLINKNDKVEFVKQFLAIINVGASIFKLFD
jgi:hypothetical protein